nr:glycoprotein precursor [Actinidia chlorotic ringspot-associated virus]
MKLIMNSVCAILVISIMIYKVNTKVKFSPTPCSCESHIKRYESNYLFCVDSCKLKPITDKLYNSTCSYMSEITVVECNGNRLIASRPSGVTDSSYSWVVFMNKLVKLLTCLSVWLICYVNKAPILLILSICHHLSKIFIKKTKKTIRSCEHCNSEVLFSHVDCPTPSFSMRTDLNLVYYIMMIIIIATTAVKAEDKNQYNYYNHGDVTEIQIQDTEHFSQDFKSFGVLYNFYVENSHLEIEYTHFSNITKPVSHSFTDMTWSCYGQKDCEKEFMTKYNDKPDFAIKKVNDGGSCVFTTATICGKCVSDHIVIAERVKAVKVSPYIDIKVTVGNRTDYIKIRDFDKYIMEPYYVKPVPVRDIETTNFIITGHHVYTGLLCMSPSESGCFGPNYIKDNTSYVYHVPKVHDPLTHDREIDLHYCDTIIGSDLSSLELTNYANHNNTIIRPYSFGMLSIGIPKEGYLTGDFCKSQVKVTSIVADGCYDCEQGFTIKVDYVESESCGAIICKYGLSKHEMFIDVHSNSVKFHAFTDMEALLITCNAYQESVKLSRSSETSVFFKNNLLVKSNMGPIDYLHDLVKILSFDYKKYIFLISISLMLVYLLYRTLKSLIHHMKVISSDRKVRYHKKFDDVDGTNIHIQDHGEHIDLVFGPAD